MKVAFGAPCRAQCRADVALEFVNVARWSPKMINFNCFHNFQNADLNFSW